MILNKDIAFCKTCNYQPLNLNRDKSRSKLHELFEFTESRELVIEAMQYSCKIVSYICPSKTPVVAKVYKSISEGRKVFRLLKFVPELALIEANDHLSDFKHFFSGMFYILDHWVWIEQVVLQRKNLETWKYMKHKFSFLASIFGLLIALRDLHRSLLCETSQQVLERLSAKSIYNFLRILISLLKLRVLKFPINSLCVGLLGLVTALLGLSNKLN